MTKQEIQLEKISSFITLEIYESLGRDESLDFDKHKEIISAILKENPDLSITEKTEFIIKRLSNYFEISEDIYRESISHALMKGFLAEY